MNYFFYFSKTQVVFFWRPDSDSTRDLVKNARVETVFLSQKLGFREVFVFDVVFAKSSQSLLKVFSSQSLLKVF